MKYIFIFFIAMSIYACNSSRNANAHTNAEQLQGQWELDYISGPKITFEGLYPSTKPYINFDVANKKISGKTGCNNFSGALITKDTTIDFSGPMAMTKMHCPGSGEQAFLDVLSKVTSYRIADSVLYFSSGDIMTMRFVRQTRDN